MLDLTNRRVIGGHRTHILPNPKLSVNWRRYLMLCDIDYLLATLEKQRSIPFSHHIMCLVSPIFIKTPHLSRATTPNTALVTSLNAKTTWLSFIFRSASVILMITIRFLGLHGQNLTMRGFRCSYTQQGLQRVRNDDDYPVKVDAQ
jgi:hypothetical protein